MRAIFQAVILTVLLFLSAPAMAQNNSQINYDTWDRQASQAEQLLDGGSATEAQLQQIRQQVIDWRAQFQDGQNANSGRIATVKDQIAALGAAPAEGETEDAEIAARRATLNEQLSTLQAPRLAAVEAFSRADSIVKEIDVQIADRQATELAQLSPSPLNPASWTEAATETAKLATGIATETSALSTRSGGWEDLRSKLPKVLGYLVLAVVLLTYGRRWIETLPNQMSARASDYSRAAVAFLVSLGQIAIPMLGIFLGISALAATEWFGDWTRPFLIALPGAGVILFGGRWLARQLFPRKAVAYDTLDIPDDKRRIARNSTNMLAAVFAVHHVLSSALLPQSGLYEAGGSQGNRVPMEFGAGATSVWHFVLIALAAVLLFRLGNVLRRIRSWSSADDTRVRNRVTTIEGSISRIVAVVTVALAAFGLINLANALIWPWLLTLALSSFLILMQDFIADVFNMLKRGESGAREGLAPLLIGLLLILLSLPLFMVIWGADRTDLAEMWTTFQKGATFGGINLSPMGVVTFIVIFGLGYAITRALQGALRNSVLPKTRIDPGGQNALVSGLGYVGIFLAGLLAVTSAGIDLSSLAIVAGALSVGIGFGLQNIVSNFVSGIILLIERPISVGDWVDAGGQQGIVKSISVRSTSVETFDRTEVIVPNSDLVSQPVTNWTRSSRNGRVIIPIGVAYGTDTRKVEQILREIIEDQPTVMIDPPPAVLFRSLGADSLNFEIRAILSDASGGIAVTSDVLHEVVRRFAEAGIEIPFAQRDIWLRNPEALAKATAGAVVTAERKADKAPQLEKPRREKDAQPVAPSAVDQTDPRLVFDDGADGDAGGDGDD
ncbi:mechanosensitive ion channel family protein [Paracoccus sp. M683]|uniref:DUF3772 domain-containing protein n=1 Tax=Paracoccus sp. M683 TaxID=2594268 RepID=UPI00117E68DB|nr:DUF3772 domain-containing protein [Paracoccus sp. M683]TRW96309.1 mechanosensitive ion channel family protein [Paracoccus sp. M683]